VLGNIQNGDKIALEVAGMDTDFDDDTHKPPGDPTATNNAMGVPSQGKSVAVISFHDCNPPDNNSTGWIGGAGDRITWPPAHGEDPAEYGLGTTVFTAAFEASRTGHRAHFKGIGHENLALMALGESPSRVQ
jgi:hypothetical protein